ncbi:mu-like prophage protein gp29 [hydrocarbon metagenome]|uniref:Mu-like prophage protein gp29 n=1 Tax=hydrocarbon metagenome TaxID=938273 RepID=A0A0W8EYI0_9ZZZZ
MPSKNDSAWNKVFAELNFLERINAEGYANVSAVTLKEVGCREPRLMAKQDTLESRPEIFRRNNLSILPTTNGEYVIFKDPHKRSYFSFDSGSSAILVERHASELSLDSIETLNLGTISSEFQAIDYAHLVSVLKSFTGETNLRLTIRGKSRSGSFQVTLPDGPTITIEGVQIEIDSGYEGALGIYLIEAKLGKREDFHIRQLFYPWREWSQKARKQVIPIFFAFSNGLFYLFQFRFGEQYGDMEIIKTKCYSVDEDPVLAIQFDALAHATPVDVAEPVFVPFPQANDLDKIIDLVVSFNDELSTKEGIAEYFEFDERQGDYYANAAIYLGFLNRGDSRGDFSLTSLGQELQRCRTRRCRNTLLLSQLFTRPTFRYSIELLRESHFNVDSISIEDIAEIIHRFDIRYNEVTRNRRASTVKSWLRWVRDNINFINE